MKLRALLFDVDGTLVDTEELHRQAFNEAFRHSALPWEWTPDLYADLLQVSGGSERISTHIDRLRVPAAEKTRLRRLVPLLHGEKRRIYCELLRASDLRFRDGVIRLAAEARAAGIKIGLAATSASASVHALVGAALARHAGAVIEAIACADQVARKKPAPDLYELLLATLRVPAAACVVFEDSSNGLAAAKAAGLCTVVTPSRWTLEQDFAGADLLLPTLDGLGLAQLEALHAAAALHEVGA